MKIRNIFAMLAFGALLFSCGSGIDKGHFSYVNEITPTTEAYHLPRGTEITVLKDINLLPRTCLTDLITKPTGREFFGLRLWLQHPDSEDDRVIKAGTKVRVYEGRSENQESMILYVQTIRGKFNFEIQGHIWTEQYRYRSPTVAEFEATGFFKIDKIPPPIPIE